MKYLKNCAILFWIANLSWGEKAQANPGNQYQKTPETCASAIHNQERRDAIPPHLLSAISHAESGRWHEEKQANFAWPWTVTSGGIGKFFNTKKEAVAEVEFLMTDGVRNIDVGCMQINLAAHANAFDTLEHAFDPIANVAYGAKYLKIMHQRTGNWLEAAGGYHSMTPHLSARYRAKISRIWKKLLATQKPIKEILTPKQPPSFSPVYPTSTINHVHLNKLNQHFRHRLSLSNEAMKQNPASRRLDNRIEQIAAWRRSQSRGEDLGVLANIRQAEHAKRRKRELARFAGGNRPVVFAERRRQQLDLWRSRHRTNPIKN